MGLKHLPYIYHKFMYRSIFHTWSIYPRRSNLFPENGFMEPKDLVEEVIIHRNHPIMHGDGTPRDTLPLKGHVGASDGFLRNARNVFQTALKTKASKNPRLPNTKPVEIFEPQKPTKKTKPQQVFGSLGIAIGHFGSRPFTFVLLRF